MKREVLVTDNCPAKGGFEHVVFSAERIPVGQVLVTHDKRPPGSTQPNFMELPPHYEEAFQRWLNTNVGDFELAPKDLMTQTEIRIARQAFMAGMWAGES